MLQRLILILLPVWLLRQASATIPETEANEDSHNKFKRNNTSPGGIRWSNLGVSFEAYDGEILEVDCSNDALWLLHPSSGYVENGSLCGVLGPSGAGKTTFLNALGGMTPSNSEIHLTGSVWYEELFTFSDSANQTDQIYLYSHLSQQDGDIAMLSQHDNFFQMLTPRESLELAAYFEVLKQRRMNPTAKDNHKELAEKKLSLLGLSSVANNRIGDRTRIGGNNGGRGWLPKANKVFSKARQSGGLSGGEKRRLSVALELVTEPKLFLADEPTTGLDSAQAEKVVKLIAKLAKERSVPSIIILHQPKSTIWHILESFVLLAPGGKMCYSGSREDAVSYFKELGYECPHDVNPSEYFIDLVTIDTEDEIQSAIDNERITFLHRKFIELSKHKTGTNSIDYITKKNHYSLSQKRKDLTISQLLQLNVNKMKYISRRFFALLRRSWRQNSRNLPVNLIRLSASVLQAILFSTIFSSIQEGKSVTKSIADRVALLTYGVINMSMMSLMKTLDLFARERGVVAREQMRNDYSSLEYLLAKVVSEMPLDAIFSWVFAIVLKNLTALRTPLVDLAKAYCLMTVASVSLGFAIGSVTSSVESAMSVGVPMMVIFMIVGVINPSGVSIEESPNYVMTFLRNLSPIRWAVEAVVTAEFRDMTFPEADRGRWGNLKNLPKMGGLALVQDGNEVLQNLGLSESFYSDLMRNLALLSGAYLLVSWAGLVFGGPKFVDAGPNFLR